MSITSSLCAGLLLTIIALIGFATASTSTTTSPYVSVRALDKYGHSEQQQNALKASNLHGTLVVVSRDPIHNATIVLSLLEGQSSRTSSIISKPSMLHITSQDSPSWGRPGSSEKTAMVCTGLRTDSNWLLSTIRAYSNRVWTRYNAFVNAPAVAQACSKILRLFWGYDLKEEWTPTLLSTEDMKWGRPLGVSCVVVSSALPFVFVVEPSGVIQRYTVFAMGKYSDEVLEKLLGAEAAVGKTPSEDLEDQLIELIQSVVPSTKRGTTSILVEILSESGIERKVVSPS